MAAITESIETLVGEQRLSVESIVASHGDFMWATFQRLGVRPGDLADALQDALIVIHRRLSDYDRSRPLEPWLFGICVRVTSQRRRRAHIRREVLSEPESDSFEQTGESRDETPEEAAQRSETRAEVEAVLAMLDPERRALLVMFEIEELSCEEIAGIIGIPKGTVHSRLYAARRAFEAAVAKRERMRKDRK